MFPGEGGSLLRFSAVKNGQQFFSHLILSRRFRKIWPREKNSFHCWPRIWRWRSGASPWEIASSSSRNAGSLFASGHQKRSTGSSGTAPWFRGCQEAAMVFPGLPCAAVSMNARRIWTERFQIRFRAGAVFFFIPGPGQELEVPFRRQRRHVSVQGDI